MKEKRVLFMKHRV